MFQRPIRNLIILNTSTLRFNYSWSLPKGHQTPISIYNCITKKKEPLIVVNPNAVTWYTCGPTVYDSAHIGHASNYVKLDILQRVLKKHFGLNIVTCMNITDIDDKIINKSIQSKVYYKEISEKYEKEFWNDLRNLGIPRPNIVLRVTDNIHVITEFIQKLESKGLTYKTQDNSVYFKNSSKLYGKLQKIGEIQSDQEENDENNKLSSKDFALWKGIKFDNEPSFNTPWEDSGRGRPGWHIECSALATKAFGTNIDIHAGGIDLRFPHHENEEVQSCAYHDTEQWVNYWIHTGHLHLSNDQKMSKSLGNTISIQALFNSNYGGKTKDIFRLLCAMSRYRSSIAFSDNLLQVADRLLLSFKHFLSTCDDVEKGILNPIVNEQELNKIIVECQRDVHQALCDDFNTPVVLEVLSTNITKINTIINSGTSTNKNNDNGCALQYILAFRNIFCYVMDLFGVDVNLHENISLKHDSDHNYIELLVKFRTDVRSLGLQTKNVELLKLCDQLRDDLNKMGIVLKDHGKMTSWS